MYGRCLRELFHTIEVTIYFSQCGCSHSTVPRAPSHRKPGMRIASFSKPCDGSQSASTIRRALRYDNPFFSARRRDDELGDKARYRAFVQLAVIQMSLSKVGQRGRDGNGVNASGERGWCVPEFWGLRRVVGAPGARQ